MPDKVHVNGSRMDRIEVVFYRTLAGAEPVRDWLLGLSPESRRAIGQDMMRVQYRWPVGMPLVRPMGKGLFEVRSRLPDSSTARLLFCFHEGAIYALHGYIKKAQRTPLEDLRLARERMKDIGNG
jgi:phage-related protein